MVFTASQASRQDAEQSPGAVAIALDRALALATLMAARSEPSPGSEVLLRWPLAQVCADLGDELQCAVFGKGGQNGEILAADLDKDIAQIGNGRCIDTRTLARSPARALRRRSGIARSGVAAHHEQQRLDLPVNLGDLALIVVPALQCLAKREQMLVGPGTAQGFRDAFGFGASNLNVAQREQALRVTLPVEDCSNDRQAAGTGERKLAAVRVRAVLAGPLKKLGIEGRSPVREPSTVDTLLFTRVHSRSPS